MANNKQTSKRVASIASGVLRDKRYSDKAKTAAARCLIFFLCNFGMNLLTAIPAAQQSKDILAALRSSL